MKYTWDSDSKNEYADDDRYNVYNCVVAYDDADDEFTFALTDDEDEDTVWSREEVEGLVEFLQFCLDK